MRIEDWSVVKRRNAAYLQGESYGNPSIKDGSCITTAIKSIKGREITTADGVYTLGEVDIMYKDAFPKHDFNSSNPIKIKVR